MDKINKNLVLFCNGISKNNDYFFLINEIRLSRNFFKKITIVPFKKNLTELDDFKYENVYIDNSLNKSFEQVINIFLCFIKVLLCKFFWVEIINLKKNLLKKIILVFKERLKSEIVFRWIKKNNFDYDENLFYSFWSNYNLISFFLIKKIDNKFKCFSRTLGSDLYGFFNNDRYVPFKKIKFSNLNLILTLNKDQKKKLLDENLIDENKIENNILGITKQNISNLDDFSDSKIIICSCGHHNHVKNTKTIIDFVKILSEIDQNRKIDYISIGSGILNEKLKSYAKKKLVNINYRFIKKVDNLVNFFKNEKVDIFINLSFAEGMSFSVMESLSCGIPVICSNIPGNREIIDEKNGYILKNYSEDEMFNLSKIIHNDLNKKENFIQKKRQCIKTTSEILDNKINSQKFIKIINKYYSNS